MEFLPTSLPDVFLIKPLVYQDERGFFLETYQAEKFKEVGISLPFVQDNHSGSRQGVLRGLHYQLKQVQGKLLRVITGEIFDVVVDIRRSSPTFGQWVGKYLSVENKLQMWAPPGFAHGFYVLSEWAEVVYKVTAYYVPEWEYSLLWNDSHIGIQWPLVNGQLPTLSPKDAEGLPLLEAELFD
jgi:dTDP-4-dehydrorhamnose 3,5-epimerase